MKDESKKIFDERTAEDEEEVDESDRHIEARDLKILVLNLFSSNVNFFLTPCTPCTSISYAKDNKFCM